MRSFQDASCYDPGKFTMIDVSALVQQCTPSNVSPVTMHQIVSVESARKPYAIGFKLIRRVDVVVGGKVVTRKEVSTLKTQPKDAIEAIEWARYLHANGYEFDAGTGQVHSTNFAQYGLTIETAFDPCTNIAAGAKILTDCYERAFARFKDQSRALTAAISCYQSGNFETGFGTGYVQKVLAAPTGKRVAGEVKQ